MLYIVSTPIGNLEDITFRAVKILKECELVLCEDTRKSSILMRTYQIDTPLISFHKYNEKKMEDKVLEKLLLGKDIALVSDAGTPTIQDPGLRLIGECIKQNIAYTALPGPCSILQSLVLSGLPSTPFQFVGYIPKAASTKTTFIQKILLFPGTSICMETASRFIDTLKIIEKHSKQRKLVAARELTKAFEDVRHGTASELISYFSKKTIRGDLLLLFEGIKLTEKLDSSSLTTEELVQTIQEFHGVDIKEATKIAAHLKGIRKNQIYTKIRVKKRT